MDSKNEIAGLIAAQGILPLFFYKDTAVCLEVLRALYRAGIRAVEFTNRGEEAYPNFQEMRRLWDAELGGMKLGIGTIKNSLAATQFIDAGADFIICPGLVEPVAKTCKEASVLWIPGCMTPTEIIAAESLGAELVKLFPGNVLGPEFVSSVKTLFPGISFMPTGGVELDKDNLAKWFSAGVCAVGMGSRLISDRLLEQKDFTAIEQLTAKTMALVRSIRQD